jgi:chaperonin GroEL
MAQSPRDNRIVLKGDEVREKLLEGAQAVFSTVSTTYGPKGRNVLIEKPFGRPLPTRDGVTVARDTYFSDRAKNMGSQLMIEASETTNRIAGDGTSATIVLAYYLLKYGIQAIAGGTHPMQLKDQLFEDSYILLERLKTLSKPVKNSQLKSVATVSAGDTMLGELIAGAIEQVGEDGGIMTEKSHVEDIEREYVDGYYLQNGFEALQAGKHEIVDPMVIVSAKRIASSSDMAQIMGIAAKQNGIEPGQGQIPKFLFIGNFEEAAYQTIVDNINRRTIDAIIIKSPPQFGNMGTQLLEDIALYAGCRLIGEADSVRSYTGNVGRVDRVVATHNESTIYADNSSEDVLTRIQEIKDRLADETVDAIAEKLRDRIAKLEGKIALFKIGGATDSEKEEKEFRVEDAIQATRAAYKDGVVAGGGITLLELSKSNVSEVYSKSLQSVFKKLLKNANLPSEVKLNEALNASKGMGYNLRKDDKLTDVVKDGVLDPTLVVEQVIKNATSVVATALTTEVILNFEDTKE